MTDNMEPSGTDAGQSDANQTSAPTGTPSAVTQEQVVGWIEEAMEAQRRKQQSTKDKGIANLQGEVSELRKTVARLNELKQAGYSDEQAVERLDLEQRVAKLEGRPITETNQDIGSSDVQVKALDPSILKEFNLDPADSRVADAFGNVDKNDPAAVLRAYVALTSGRQTNTNEGQQMPFGTGGSAQVRTLESVTAELDAANRKLNKTSDDFKRIGELNKELSQIHAESIN